MKRRHLLLSALAVAMGAAGSTPSWAVINNGGGGGYRQACDDLDGLLGCFSFCYAALRYSNLKHRCEIQCYHIWCTGRTTRTIVRNPVRSNGNPVEAPPPSRYRKPIHAPIIKGRPIHAAPTNPPTGQPILGRNSGGGHRH